MGFCVILVNGRGGSFFSPERGVSASSLVSSLSLLFKGREISWEGG